MSQPYNITGPIQNPVARSSPSKKAVREKHVPISSAVPSSSWVSRRPMKNKKCYVAKLVSLPSQLQVYGNAYSKLSLK